ncbi:MAG: FapA family protein [Eubacteriales bacterium]|nr:FapA family protein [Eubacteriales bacterium]
MEGNETFKDSLNSIDVQVSDDGMAGYIKMEEVEGATEAISVSQIKEALAREKIVHGIDENVLEKLAQRPIYRIRMQVAQGIKPVDGENGQVVYHVEKDADYHPDYTEEGTVDYKSLNYFQTAKKDQLLCEIISETEGTEGINIYGVSVPARRGNPPISPMGKNTVLSEDGTRLLAACDGVIKYTRDKVDIQETLNIPSNVDQLTGNIDFTGDVVIGGDVCDGFSVKSGGNIIVKGVVECARLEAAGSIHISNGINGGDRADIIAGSDFRSLYIENAVLHVQGNIYADYIIGSIVTCMGNVELMGRKELIIGGEIKVSGNINAREIGNESERVTLIEVLGIETTDTEAICQMKEERDSCAGNLKAISEVVERFNTLRESRSELLPEEQYEAARKQMALLKEKVGLLNHQIKRLEAAGRVEYNGMIVCKKKIYPGVTICYGEKRNGPYTEGREHCRIYWQEGEILQGAL